MIPNLIVLFAGLFILYFVALFWLRQNLMNDLATLRQNELILKKDLEKRRDLVPFLLEGAREGAQTSDAWQALARKHAAFTQATSFSEEVEFGIFLQDYIAQNPCKTVMFLEGKKEIQDLTVLAETQKTKLRELSETFNQKRKQFPYSLASAMFGVREVTISA